jgi:hypothetical protein
VVRTAVVFPVAAAIKLAGDDDEGLGRKERARKPGGCTEELGIAL